MACATPPYPLDRPKASLLKACQTSDIRKYFFTKRVIDIWNNVSMMTL